MLNDVIVYIISEWELDTGINCGTTIVIVVVVVVEVPTNKLVGNCKQPFFSILLLEYVQHLFAIVIEMRATRKLIN